MAIDLTGGIDPAREQMFARRPDNPEMRDSVSFWVIDDHGDVGLPRIGIEAVAANWDAHDVQINVAFPDGRVFRLRENGQSWPAEAPDGAADRARRGRAGVPLHRSVRHLDDDLRRQGGADLVDGSDRREKGRAVGRRQLSCRGQDGGSAVGAGRLVRRVRVAAEDLDRGQPDGRAALRAAVPRDGSREGW